jgi:hypothetical protein
MATKREPIEIVLEELSNGPGHGLPEEPLTSKTSPKIVNLNIENGVGTNWKCGQLAGNRV